LITLRDQKLIRASNRYYQIRKDSFFLEEKQHIAFLQNGWVKIKDVVKQEEIDSFMETFDEISKLDGFELR
jgi:hypothetical protein